MQRRYIALGMILPVILLLLLLGIYPLIYSLWLSLHSYNLLEPTRGIRYVGLRNFFNLFTRSGIIGISLPYSLYLTMVFVTACLGLEVGIGLGIAVIMSRRSSRSLLRVRTLIMVPMLLAPIVVGNVFKYMYQYSFGLFNFVLRILRLPTPHWLSHPSWSMISLIIADVWEWLPFSFLILLAAIFSLPQEQQEAAQIDGASASQLFLHITLPGIKSAILIILLIRGIELIKTFDLVYIVTYGGPANTTSILPFNAYLLGFKYFEIGEAAAYAYFMLVVINLFVLLFINVLRKEVKVAH